MIDEQDAWRDVDEAYARLANTSHRSSEVVAARIEAEHAVKRLKLIIGVSKPPMYSTNELQALRAAGFTDKVIWKGYGR